MFSRVLAVDWSASTTPSPRGPAPAAPWVAMVEGEGPPAIVPPDGASGPTNHRTRASVLRTVEHLLDEGEVAGPTLIGWDFGFGYPAGFAAAVGLEGWEGVWAHLASAVVDGDDNGNNRLEVAADLNRRFDGPGPFWGEVRRPDGEADHLPAVRSGIVHAGGPGRGGTDGQDGFPFAERRLTEQVLPRAQPMFKMAYTGSVGSQSVVGIARLECLRRTLGRRVVVWPFHPLPLDEEGRLPADVVVVAEIYPRLFTPAGPHPRAGPAAHIPDANQVLHSVQAMRALPASAFATAWMPPAVREEEGWVLTAPRPPGT